MIYVLAVIAGIVGAVVGWFLTAGVAAWIAALFGMSDFEGARGMFAAFVAGPIGALIFMVAAIWIVLRRGAGYLPLGSMMGRLAGVLMAIAMLVAAGIWIRLHTIDTYTNSLPPTLEFEVRVPDKMTVPAPQALRVELHTDRNVGEGLLAEQWLATADGRYVIAGSVPLAFKTASRLLVVTWPEQPTRLFRLRLSRDPSSTRSMGDWQRANHVDVGGEGGLRAAPADDPVEVRYRVRRAGED